MKYNQIVNEDFVENIKTVSEGILNAHNRWDGSIFSEIYSKTLFKLILTDYYFLSKIKSIVDENIKFNFIDIFSLGDIKEKMSKGLTENFNSYINQILEEKHEIRDVLDVISHYKETRNFFSNYLYSGMRTDNSEKKKNIAKISIEWLTQISNTADEFFFKIKLADTIDEYIGHDLLFSNDMFKTFKNSIDRIDSTKRVLFLAQSINFIPIMLWFDGYEITLASSSVNLLEQMKFSVDQFTDLETNYQFNPAIKGSLSDFAIIYANPISLNRFNSLEYQSYSGILCNFIFSSFKESLNEIMIQKFFRRVGRLLLENGYILLQEETKYKNLIEKSIETSNFKLLLKINTFEGIDRTNWLLKKL